LTNGYEYVRSLIAAEARRIGEKAFLFVEGLLFNAIAAFLKSGCLLWSGGKVMFVQGRINAVRTIRILICWVCLAAVLWGPGSSAVYGAEKESTHIPVVVNILKGAGVTKAEAKKAVEEASKIMEKAGFTLRIVGEINTNVAIGNSDGDLTRAERDKAREEGGKELMDKTKHKNQKGIKIYFANKPKETSPGTTGISVHKKKNDGKEYGDPTIIVKKNPHVGSTIAHEIGHVLTLGPGHKLDASTNATAGGHVPAGKEAKFPKNVMKSAPGDKTEWTPDQIKKMKKHKYRVGKCTKQWDDSYPAAKREQQYGAQTDSLGDQAPGTEGMYDLHQVVMTSLASDDDITVTLVLNDLYPASGAVDARYELLFDTDGDGLTGNIVAGFPGIERGVEIRVSGDQSVGPLTVEGYVITYSAGPPTSEALPSDPCLGTDVELIEHMDGYETATEISNSFVLDVPKSMLAMTADDVPMGVTAGDSSFVYDTMAMYYDRNKWEDDATLTTFGNGTPEGDQPYPFRIEGLNPLDSFELYADDQLVATGMLDGSGGFEGDFIWPSELSSEEMHFLTAQDSTGEFAYSMSCPDWSLADASGPADSETSVPSDANLAWTPGAYATWHDVYLGFNYAAVRDADTSTAGVYKGRQPVEANSYNPAGHFDLGTTYYWRIDEVNDSEGEVWKGEVWSFTTADYLLIDDFESYDKSGPNAIWFTWDDGLMNWSGSIIDLGQVSQGPVYDGVQSMECDYDNWTDWGYGAYVSEVSRTFDDLWDWTDPRVKALAVYFYGRPGNAAGATERLYVGLEDVTGPASYAEFRYGLYGPGEDMSHLQEPEWHEWNIKLEDFTAAGVDLTAIKKMYVGFGDRTNTTTPGGSGVVWFDAFRLYQPRCKASFMKPMADLDCDCLVYWGDLAVLGDHWLRTDAQLTRSAVSSGPVGWWKLDEGSGNVAADSSVYANHGTVQDDYSWVSGRIGPYALNFSGAGGRVLVPDAVHLRPATQVSVSAWVKCPHAQSDYGQVVVKGIQGQESYWLQVSGDTLSFSVRDAGLVPYTAESGSLGNHGRVYPDEWTHVGGTYDGVDVTCYVNGRPAAATPAPGLVLWVNFNNLAIGNRLAQGRGFIGTVDDVQVYNYGLSAAEVAYLATQGTGYVPLVSQVNLHSGESPEAINISDLAVLLNSWLEQKLWPE
jgi:hypothetical protein